MENLKRTTLRLKRDLLKGAKKLALEQDITVQDVMNEALKRYLLFETKKGAKLKFKDFHMGKIKGKITRNKIYAEI